MTQSLKAIETVYDGYRFRSRLEARWAVFFNTLGIKYEYEKEGYDLDGVWYLPDFWLPEQSCWFEVKGQTPTFDEHDKALRLAWFSQKSVYMAREEMSLKTAFMQYYNDYMLCSFSTWAEDDWLLDVSRKRYYHNSDNARVFPLVHLGHSDLNYQIVEILICLREDGLGFAVFDDKIYVVGGNTDRVTHYQILMNSHCDDILSLFGKHQKFAQGAVWYIATHDNDAQWTICPSCKYVDIHSDAFGLCNKCKRDNYINNHPRLINAYNDARQARFEYGNKRDI